ncbi:26S proteasome non-ATPase regulatory subunit 5 [Chytridiales sp. JEL 0842]|nr:26S proteasome non-ATPase regulatory subunit 5 [Chytridiales sp. JEL 0842]
MANSPAATALNEATTLLKAALPNAANKPEDLVEAVGAILVVISGLADTQLRSVLPSVPLDEIVLALTVSPNTESLNMCCTCLERVLPMVGFEQLFGKYQALVFQGLDHPSERVRKLILSILALARESEQCIQKLIAVPEALRLAMESLSFEGDASVAYFASDVLVMLCTSDFFLSKLLDPYFSFLLQDLLSRTELVKFRTFELIIRIAAVSAKAFDQLKEQGLLEDLLGELESGDIMLVLNGVETLTKLINSQKGYEFLDQSQVFHRMTQTLNPLSDSTSGLLADPISKKLVRCSLISFFAKVSLTLPHHLSDLNTKTQLLPVLGQLCEAEDITTEEIESLLILTGNIGSSTQGLQLLQTYHSLDSKVSDGDLLSFLIHVIRRGVGQARIVALQSLSCIFDRPTTVSREESQMLNESQFCETLFHEIQEFSYLLASGKSAIDESRIATYAILKGVFRFAWGLQSLKESGDLVSWLLTREFEGNKVGKEWRFSISQVVVGNPAAEAMLGRGLYDRFLKYVKEGPFYHYLEPTVAVQSM